jgi:succinyl-diaminopimelate desuccinylase
MAEVEAELDARLRAHPGVRWRRISGREATWSGLEEPFVAGFAEVVDEVRGRPVDLTVSARPSDAGRWRALRVPAVGYGLGAALTARTDESVEEQDVVDCATVYALAAFDHLST